MSLLDLTIHSPNGVVLHASELTTDADEHLSVGRLVVAIDHSACWQLVPHLGLPGDSEGQVLHFREGIQDRLTVALQEAKDLLVQEFCFTFVLTRNIMGHAVTHFEFLKTQSAKYN